MARTDHVIFRQRGLESGRLIGGGGTVRAGGGARLVAAGGRRVLLSSGAGAEPHSDGGKSRRWIHAAGRSGTKQDWFGNEVNYAPEERVSTLGEVPTRLRSRRRRVSERVALESGPASRRLPNWGEFRRGSLSSPQGRGCTWGSLNSFGPWSTADASLAFPGDNVAVAGPGMVNREP